MPYRNPDVKRAYDRKRYQDNPELIKQRVAADYTKNKDARKATMLAYLKKRQAEKLNHVRELKSQPCCACNQRYHYCVMDFDHLPDREAKIANVSVLLANTRVTLAQLQAEIAKCELVCSNCHRLRTFERNEHVKD